jgi:hypothetical protein
MRVCCCGRYLATAAVYGVTTCNGVYTTQYAYAVRLGMVGELHTNVSGNLK